jgi:hypothetical protein
MELAQTHGLPSNDEVERRALTENGGTLFRSSNCSFLHLI